MLDLKTYRILEKCFQTSAVLKHDFNIKQKLIKPEFQNYSTLNLVLHFFYIVQQMANI